MTATNKKWGSEPATAVLERISANGECVVRGGMTRFEHASLTLLAAHIEATGGIEGIDVPHCVEMANELAAAWCAAQEAGRGT